MSKKISLLLVLSIVFANINCQCDPAGQGPEIDPNDNWTQYAYDVWKYTNKLRQDPDFIRDKIQTMLDGIQGKFVFYPGSNKKIKTGEGAAGQKEAIADLKKQDVLCPMSWSDGMTFANKDHIIDAKATMEDSDTDIGHNSSNGDSPWDRMDKYGQWGGTVGENLSYGAMNGMNAVIQLYIDDGVPWRGHRNNLTNPDFLVMGAAAGEFPDFGNIMTQNFAKTFKEAPENYPSRRSLHVDDAPLIISEKDARKLAGQDNVPEPDRSNIDYYSKDARRLFRRRSFN